MTTHTEPIDRPDLEDWTYATRQVNLYITPKSFKVPNLEQLRLRYQIFGNDPVWIIPEHVTLDHMVKELFSREIKSTLNEWQDGYAEYDVAVYPPGLHPPVPFFVYKPIHGHLIPTPNHDSGKGVPLSLSRNTM